MDLRKNGRIDRERWHVSSFSFRPVTKIPFFDFNFNRRKFSEKYARTNLPSWPFSIVRYILDPREYLKNLILAREFDKRYATKMENAMERGRFLRKAAATTRESESLVLGWKDASASDATQAKAIVQPGLNDLAVSTRLITAPRCANNRRAAIAKSGVPPRHATPRIRTCALHVIRCNYGMNATRYTRVYVHRLTTVSRVRRVNKNINSERGPRSPLFPLAHPPRFHPPILHPDKYAFPLSLPVYRSSPTEEQRSLRRFPFFRTASRYKMRNATFDVESLFKQKSKGKKNCSQGTEASRTEKKEREKENEL